MARAGMPRAAFEQVVVASELPSIRHVRRGTKRAMAPLRVRRQLRARDSARAATVRAGGDSDVCSGGAECARRLKVVSHTPLVRWLDQHTGAHRGARGARLWECVENYYVKTFSGWTGSQAEMARGVGALELERAKATLLREDFTMLITEVRRVNGEYSRIHD